MPSPPSQTRLLIEATDTEELQALSWLARCNRQYRALDVACFIVINVGHWELRRVKDSCVLASSWVDLNEDGTRELHCFIHFE